MYGVRDAESGGGNEALDESTGLANVSGCFLGGLQRKHDGATGGVG